MSIAQEFAAIVAQMELGILLSSALRSPFPDTGEGIVMPALPSNKEIIQLLDFTLLNPQATLAQLKEFENKAQRYPVASVCLLANHLQQIDIPLSVKRATVVNFPQGSSSTTQVLRELDYAVHYCKANEIDYVFPYQHYLEGNKNEALAACQEVYQFCQQAGVLLKVIIESGAFTCIDTLYEASVNLVNQGCDFLKTSTGKTAIGATPLAAFTLLKASRASDKPCGIKISGGVKRLADAQLYIKLAQLSRGQAVTNHWFRLGASSLLDELVS